MINPSFSNQSAYNSIILTLVWCPFLILGDKGVCTTAWNTYNFTSLRVCPVLEGV